MKTKSDRDRKKISDIDSIPFNILQEEDFFILIHKFKPSWIVTNEVGKEIAVRYFLKDSSSKIAKFLKQCFYPSNDLEKDIEEFIKTLKNVGFEEENHLAEQEDQEDNFKGILFLVTQACNLSCHHCSIESIPTVSNAISKDIFYKIVDEAVSAGASNLLISGGEPLVRKDIFDLIEYAAQHQKVSLLTNGTLIGKKEAEQLNKTGISEIVLSLDGALPETHDKLRGKGNFESVVRGIDLLRKEGLVEKINLNYCLSKYNIGEANDFLEFVRTLGVSKITFLPIKKVGRASGAWEDLRPNRDDYEKFLFKLYDSYFQPDFALKVNFPLSGFHPVIKPGERVSTCPFGSQLIVNGEGDIYTCPALFIPDFHLGNVFKTSIKDALNSTKLKDLKEKYRLRIEKIDRCQKCTWRSFCQGGCTSAVYLEEGTFWETDDLCELRDKLYRKAIVTAVKNKNLGRNITHAGSRS